MLTYEIIESKLQDIKRLDDELVCREIEEVIANYHLTITQKTTLRTKKGSYHWHTKKEKQAGVLEITYWPQKGRLWLEIADNRLADWNHSLIEDAANCLAERFAGKIERLKV
ncbi:hypothetical protein [Sediminibacillus albus]|uniref:Uncharacterized protein n=1 Tax=Sediminibacillus albus TaxID=407036 RepID=A0A1G9ARG1_9BACI|nr:hypothetical protein [Sediminibacillus albus]SDK29926.1 hypothetical protein SAMN05216243_2684 [Sediminibacillus albus]